MGVQSKAVDLQPAWKDADDIKLIRKHQKLVMERLQDALAMKVRFAVTQNRTDYVPVSEIKAALRSTFERAGFSTSRKILERYL